MSEKLECICWRLVTNPTACKKCFPQGQLSVDAVGRIGDEERNNVRKNRTLVSK
jgi:hypothetical protein